MVLLASQFLFVTKEIFYFPLGLFTIGLFAIWFLPSEINSFPATAHWSLRTKPREKATNWKNLFFKFTEFAC